VFYGSSPTAARGRKARFTGTGLSGADDVVTFQDHRDGFRLNRWGEIIGTARAGHWAVSRVVKKALCLLIKSIRFPGKVFENAGIHGPVKRFVGVEGSQPIGGVRTFLQLGQRDRATKSQNSYHIGWHIRRRKTSRLDKPRGFATQM
jgi:hypothetical protein